MVCISDKWNETYFKYFLKDPNYNIVIMSTFSGLTVPGINKEDKIVVNVDVFKFKYLEVVAGNYRYRDFFTTTIH